MWLVLRHACHVPSHDNVHTGKRAPFPTAAPILPRELLYPPDFYYYLMISNLALRFLWLTRLVPSWAASCLVCCIVSCLEVCRYVIGPVSSLGAECLQQSVYGMLISKRTCPHRRAQWAFVRVEVELRKVQQQRPELGRLVPAVAPYHVVADGNAGRVWDTEALESLAA